jgi:hypothetical protein
MKCDINGTIISSQQKQIKKTQAITSGEEISPEIVAQLT